MPKLTRAFANRLQKERMKENDCPVCNYGTLQQKGKLRPGGTGRYRYIYVCSRCGFKTLR